MARSRAGKLSLRHSYPESGPKPTTYDAWGAAARRYQPGGLAGAESSFIIGGSYYEHGGIPSYIDSSIPAMAILYLICTALMQLAWSDVCHREPYNVCHTV